MHDPTNSRSSAETPGGATASVPKWGDGWTPEELARMDADLRIALALIAGKDWRTGIVVYDRKSTPDAPPQRLPLVIELEDKSDFPWTWVEVKDRLALLNVRVTQARSSSVTPNPSVTWSRTAADMTISLGPASAISRAARLTPSP